MNKYYGASVVIGSIGIGLICSELGFKVLATAGFIMILLSILMMLDFIRENTGRKKN